MRRMTTAAGMMYSVIGAPGGPAAPLHRRFRWAYAAGAVVIVAAAAFFWLTSSRRRWRRTATPDGARHREYRNACVRTPPPHPAPGPSAPSLVD
jgi:hypothetical protein